MGLIELYLIIHISRIFSRITNTSTAHHIVLRYVLVFVYSALFVSAKRIASQVAKFRVKPLLCLLGLFRVGLPSMSTLEIGRKERGKHTFTRAATKSNG